MHTTLPNEPANSMVSPHEPSCFYLGLTKREYFAAMAMQGILAAGYIAHEGETSKTAVIHADALIKALNQ